MTQLVSGIVGLIWIRL